MITLSCLNTGAESVVTGTQAEELKRDVKFNL